MAPSTLNLQALENHHKSHKNIMKQAKKEEEGSKVTAIIWEY
jgi:hypothetical protein